jgi:hypothetical protein
VSGFALSYAANIIILMILYGLWLLPAHFYIHLYVWKVENGVQIADRYSYWQISNDAEIFLLQVSQVFAAKSNFLTGHA